MKRSIACIAGILALSGPAMAAALDMGLEVKLAIIADRSSSVRKSTGHTLDEVAMEDERRLTNHGEVGLGLYFPLRSPVRCDLAGSIAFSLAGGKEDAHKNPVTPRQWMESLNRVFPGTVANPNDEVVLDYIERQLPRVMALRNTNLLTKMKINATLWVNKGTIVGSENSSKMHVLVGLALQKRFLMKVSPMHTEHSLDAAGRAVSAGVFFAVKISETGDYKETLVLRVSPSYWKNLLKVNGYLTSAVLNIDIDLLDDGVHVWRYLDGLGIQIPGTSTVLDLAGISESIPEDMRGALEARARQLPKNAGLNVLSLDSARLESEIRRAVEPYIPDGFEEQVWHAMARAGTVMQYSGEALRWLPVIQTVSAWVRSPAIRTSSRAFGRTLLIGDLMAGAAQALGDATTLERIFTGRASKAAELREVLRYDNRTLPLRELMSWVGDGADRISHEDLVEIVQYAAKDPSLRESGREEARRWLKIPSIRYVDHLEKFAMARGFTGGVYGNRVDEIAEVLVQEERTGGDPTKPVARALRQIYGLVRVDEDLDRSSQWYMDLTEVDVGFEQPIESAPADWGIFSGLFRKHGSDANRLDMLNELWLGVESYLRVPSIPTVTGKKLRD